MNVATSPCRVKDLAPSDHGDHPITRSPDHPITRFFLQVRRDLLSVKASILDEYFVCVHAGDDNTGQKHSCARAFQSIWIRARAQRFRLQRDAGSVEKFQVGTISDQRDTEQLMTQNTLMLERLAAIEERVASANFRVTELATQLQAELRAAPAASDAQPRYQTMEQARRV